MQKKTAYVNYQKHFCKSFDIPILVQFDRVFWVHFDCKL